MQMQVILETLARVKIKKKPDPLPNLLAKGYNIPWGVSCLNFAYGNFYYHVSSLPHGYFRPFGSYARGDRGVGSVLDLIAMVNETSDIKSEITGIGN
jgi:hypothetical protein